LLTMLGLKCLILRVKICKLFEKSKNEENTTWFYQINSICFRIELLCIGWVGCKGMHLIPLRLYSSYMKGFNVKTYIVDLIEYMCCALFILLNFQRKLQISTRSIRHFKTKIFSKLSKIKLKSNIMMIPHIFRENVM